MNYNNSLTKVADVESQHTFFQLFTLSWKVGDMDINLSFIWEELARFWWSHQRSIIKLAKRNINIIYKLKKTH